jgi:mono/diheme cytochrome c family protein
MGIENWRTLSFLWRVLPFSQWALLRFFASSRYCHLEIIYGKNMKKKKIIAFITCVLFALLVVSYVESSYNTHTFELPPTGIKSSRDIKVIERGRYLVMGPAHCWNCHAADGETNLQTGTRTGMSGGLAFKIPFGTIYSPNITPDAETGIGSYSDEQLASVIRHNLKHDNTALIPFMSFNGMNDPDVTAVISYLRSIKPIRNKVPANDLNFLGKIVKRFIIKPKQTLRPKTLALDTSAAYGEYLAISVANCYSCHTNRDKNTGEFIGEKFGGGFEMKTLNAVFTTPNLTPDVQTGAIAGWTSKDFITRFRTGAIFPDTPMPWKPYSSMSDTELKALYNYFKQLKPTRNKVVAYRPLLYAKLP